MDLPPPPSKSHIVTVGLNYRRSRHTSFFLSLALLLMIWTINLKPAIAQTSCSHDPAQDIDLSNSSTYNGKIGVLGSNFVWSTASTNFEGDIIIPSGYSLTISGKRIEFAAGCRIWVHNGGKLYITNGTVLTKYCNERWDGIYVAGDRNIGQSSNTGFVRIDNSSIEWAKVGVVTGDQWNDQGGWVLATDANFLNCRKSAAFLSYPFNNQSKFVRCNFACDALGGLNNNGVESFVTIWDNKGIQFEGCSFINSVLDATYNTANLWGNNTTRGNGIYSIDASYTIKDVCDIGPIIPLDPYACFDDYECIGGRIRNTFSGLSVGVFINDTHGPLNRSNSVNVQYCDFINNVGGHYIDGNGNSRGYLGTDVTAIGSYETFLTHNTHLSDGNFSNFSIGVNGRNAVSFYEYLNDGKNYHSDSFEISNSLFRNNQSNAYGSYTSIYIENSGDGISKIHGNTFRQHVCIPLCFSESFIGIATLGNNLGLQVNCNVFDITPSDINYVTCQACSGQGLSDWYMADNGMTGAITDLEISNQGTASLGAGNHFTDYTPHLGNTLAILNNIQINSGAVPSPIIDYFSCPTCSTNDYMGTPYANNIPMIINTVGAVFNAISGAPDKYCPPLYCKHFAFTNNGGPEPGSPPMGGDEGEIHSRMVTSIDNQNNNQVSKKVLAIYPNPAFNHLKIEYTLTKDIQRSFSGSFNILITDISGKTIANKKLSNLTKGTLDLDISSYPSGIYFLKLQTNEKTISNEKFTVAH